MSTLERMTLRHAHPRYLLVAYIALLWAFYFLWEHLWIYALAAVVLGIILSRVVTLGVKEENLAQTTLGQIMLLHLHPANIVLQICGAVLVAYGVWIHSAIYILAAISVSLAGHMWGWHRVSEAY
jgi:hypothetical protein